MTNSIKYRLVSDYASSRSVSLSRDDSLGEFFQFCLDASEPVILEWDNELPKP